ncbi:hypothetical protein HAHI6034_06655 [Hathewaya histolytica]|uniref:Uncharacterized protein n=1 Tax=Hathewaya histolytica TaxID=1498 RepID=A0A4U9RWM2_HATHI|nr:hypothetical protein [Hathewaya histolytica]VTQ96106.1 Uncharacterised protein [Hathewaya histolytica]
MGNTNTSLKWLHKKTNIFLDERIEHTNHPIRGICGIFIKDENKKDKNERCVYVGHSKSIYGRMFESNKGHVVMMRVK